MEWPLTVMESRGSRECWKQCRELTAGDLECALLISLRMVGLRGVWGYELEILSVGRWLDGQSGARRGGDCLSLRLHLFDTHQCSMFAPDTWKASNWAVSKRDRHGLHCFILLLIAWLIDCLIDWLIDFGLGEVLESEREPTLIPSLNRLRSLTKSPWFFSETFTLCLAGLLSDMPLPSLVKIEGAHRAQWRFRSDCVLWNCDRFRPGIKPRHSSPPLRVGTVCAFEDCVTLTFLL